MKIKNSSLLYMLLVRFERILLFLAILFLPTQLGRHFWPEFSFVYSLKIDYLSPAVYFWDILVVFLLIVALINKISLNRTALNLFFFFMFTQILSLVNSSNIGAGLFRLEQYLIAGFFGIYVASLKFKARLPDGQVQSAKLYVPLILAVIFESILAICQVIKGGSVGFWILGERSFSSTTPAIAKFDFYGIELLRPYATFPHPNVLAAFLLLGLFILFFAAYRPKGFSAINILAVSALALTFSRTALVVLAVSGLLFLKKKMFLVVVLLTLSVSPLLFVRFSSLLNYDNLTVLRRAELAERSFEYFLRSPVFGVGLNNFIPTLSYDMVSGPNRFLQPVHNIYLLALSETGLIGLIGWVILLYPLKNFKFEILNLKLGIIWGTVLFLGFFDHYFLTIPQGYRMLFFIWGLSMSRDRIFK